MRSRPPPVRDRGHERPRVDPRRAVPAPDHPARQVAVDPAGDGPVEVRGEVDGLAGAAAVGGRDDDGRADVVERLRLQHADRRDPAAVRRDRRLGRIAGGREDLARLGGPRLAGRVHVHRPDRGARREVRVRAAIAGEDHGPAVGVPRDVADAPVAAGDLPRHGAPLQVDDPQVRPAVDVALLVPAPVDAVDPAGAGAVLVGGPDPGDRSDEPAWRVHLRGEGDPRPVRRPGDLADAAVAAAPDVRTRPPSMPISCRVAGASSSAGSVRTNATVRPVGRDPRARVADDAAGQDPRSVRSPPRDRRAARPAGSRDSGSRGWSGGRRPPSTRRATGRAPRRRPGAGCRPGSSRGRSGRWAMAAVRVAGGRPARHARPSLAPRRGTGEWLRLTAMFKNRLVIRPGGRLGAGRRPGRRRPRVDAHQPRPPVPGEPRGGPRLRGRGPRVGRRPGDGRGHERPGARRDGVLAAGGSSRRPRRGRSRRRRGRPSPRPCPGPGSQRPPSRRR